MQEKRRKERVSQNPCVCALCFVRKKFFLFSAIIVFPIHVDSYIYLILVPVVLIESVGCVRKILIKCLCTGVSRLSSSS